MLSCMSCLYILKIKPLSVASFVSIFSHSVGCLFVLFMVSFAVQKLVSSIRSHLLIFAFISFLLGNWWFMSENVLCMLPSMSFMVSCLIFKSLSYFQFIFEYGVRECSNFVDLHAAVQLSQCQLLKTLSFLHCIFLPPLSKINWPNMCVYVFLSGGYQIAMVFRYHCMYSQESHKSYFKIC